MMFFGVRVSVSLVLTVVLLTPLAGHEQWTNCCVGQHEDAVTVGHQARMTPKVEIDDLRRLQLPDLRLTSVDHRHRLPANDAMPTSKAIEVQHVNVHGVIGKAIGFDLNLPDRWNGRIVMGGGGGLVGTCEHAARGDLEWGYATVGTDTGHVSPTPFTADWALFDAEAQVNFGHLAVHRTIEAAKAIVTAYYKKSADFTYFVGCSTGGRQALMEVQRYPRDFDGIVCGCPVRENIAEAVGAGADSVVIAAPWLVRFVNRDFARRYFLESLECACPVPKGIYVIAQPAETGMDCDFWREIAGHPQVAYLKDSSGSAEYRRAFAEVKARRPELALRTGCEFDVLSAMGDGYAGSLLGTALSRCRAASIRRRSSSVSG